MKGLKPVISSLRLRASAVTGTQRQRRRWISKEWFVQWRKLIRLPITSHNYIISILVFFFLIIIILTSICNSFCIHYGVNQHSLIRIRKKCKSVSLQKGVEYIIINYHQPPWAGARARSLNGGGGYYNHAEDEVDEDGAERKRGPK